MGADVRAEIDSVNGQFVEGASRGDVAAMGGVYTDDARILPPGQGERIATVISESGVGRT